MGLRQESFQPERVDAFNAPTSLAFTAETARCNLVTVGADLNTLVCREFRIGEVVLRGTRLCEPCSYPVKITHPDVLRGLIHKGGLRAQIVIGGHVPHGDFLEPLDRFAP